MSSSELAQAATAAVVSAGDALADGHRPLLGLAPLLRAAFQHQDLSVHVPGLIERAERDGDAYALLDLALIQLLRFEKANGLAVLAEALKQQTVFRLQQAEPSALRLLLIKTPGDLMANTPIECILESATLTVDVLYVGSGLAWPQALPPHDLLFVAISEADVHRPILAELARRLTDWPCPVLNAPQRIPALSRSEAFAVLREVPDICMASTQRLGRDELLTVCARKTGEEVLLADIAFPLIVRPLGSHAGTDLARVESPAALGEYLQRVAADAFFVASFIDYASPDGLFRKYRVVLIDGRAYVCHMGISQHWMVHYPYDEMKADPARRAEEAAFMADFDAGFARRHADALAQMHARFGLDYVGFDCAESKDGRLLIFEMANALVIHAIDDPAIFPYKAGQMQKVFGAFHDMLRRKAGR